LRWNVADLRDRTSAAATSSATGSSPGMLGLSSATAHRAAACSAAIADVSLAKDCSTTTEGNSAGSTS
jgi:hypothetical protein